MDLNDFGFTAVTEEELDSVQHIKAEAEMINDSAEELQARLDKLYEAIQPLLENLKLNPEKPIIHWPNRVEKVESFQAHIETIYKG